MAETDSIAKAYLQIVPSAKGIKGALGKVMDPEAAAAGHKAGGTLGSSLVGRIKSIVATAGIGAAIGKSISAGGNLQQSLGGIETLFKESADQVVAKAQQAYRTAGMDANAYMELTTSFAASLLQGLGGDTAKAAQISDMAMTDMSDNANKMGTDMERITDAYQGFAKQNYTMLDNLKLGYGGTKGEMERLLADAQKISGIEYNIDNLADVYSAIHVIQNELDITGTTAKEASTTLQGSAQAMKAAFTNVLADLALGRDLKASLGALTQTTMTFLAGNLLPAIAQVLSGLPTVLSAAFTAAIQGLNQLTTNADSILQLGINLVTGIGSAIITALPYLAESAVSVVAAFGNAIITTDWTQIGTDTITSIRDSLDLAAGEILGVDGNIIGAVLTAIRTNLPNVLMGGTEILTNIMSGLMSALPGLVDAGGSMMQSLLETILAVLPSMLDSGVELIGQLAQGLINNLPAVLDSVSNILMEMVATIAAYLPDLLDHGIRLIGKLASGLWQNLPAVLTSISNILAKLLYSIASYLPDLLQKGLELIGQLAAGLIRAIPDAVAAIPKLISRIKSAFMRFNWKGLGKDIIRGLIEGIGSMGGALWDAAKSVARSCLDSIKSALGIRSPSRVMRKEVGPHIPAGMALGVLDNVKPLTSAMSKLSTISLHAIPARFRSKSTYDVPARRVAAAPTINVNVYGVPGQSVDDLADAVMMRMQTMISRTEGGLCACG